MHAVAAGSAPAPHPKTPDRQCRNLLFHNIILVHHLYLKFYEIDLPKFGQLSFMWRLNDANVTRETGDGVSAIL